MSRTAYHNGLAAEDIALTLYPGAKLRARRARTAAGEIDLILEAEGQLIFVEVKARKTHAAAALSLSPRQQARILAGAEAWMAANALPLDSPCRFDVVTVAADGSAERIENALSA